MAAGLGLPSPKDFCASRRPAGDFAPEPGQGARVADRLAATQGA